ncbi:MAG: hypothetical protein ACXWRE_00925 [Pseudobdellovibrionaceae bacterium]
MFSQVLFKFLNFTLVLNMFLTISVFANEAKEEKKESAGAAEAGAGESNVTEPQKKQMNEATELQARVQALRAKVKSKEEIINKLIEDKNHTKDPEKVKEIISEIVTEHKEMSKMVEEYEQNRSLLRYRYPEKGYAGTRSYERMEVKPLEQMESQMSIEAKLNRNLRTIHSQYREPAEIKNSKKKKAQKKEEEAPSLTEPIYLHK